jgi:hypothetical protein
MSLSDNITEQNDVNRILGVSQELPGIFCNLIIDKYEISTSNIRNIQIRTWVFDLLPRIQITFRDDSLFFNYSTFTDKSIIEITLGSSEEDFDKKTYYFDLGNYEFNKVNDVSTVTVTGYLKTTNIFQIRTLAYSDMTSNKVIEKIAKDLSLKYKESDGINVSDKMTWLQVVNNFDFIKYIMNKASINNDIPLIFADLDGNLNYKALKTEINNIRDTTKLEYKTDLFNMKTPASIEEYKKKNKKPEKYGNCFSFSVKNIQQYLDYFIGNGTDICYVDYDTGKPLISTVAGKTYPILTNSENFKSNEGKIVNTEFFGIRNDTTHAKFLFSETENNYNIASFFSQAFCTNVNYLCKLNLLDSVDIDIPSFINNDMTDMNVPYSGKYIVGGMFMNFKLSNKSILPSKEVWLFRPGTNKPIY